MTFLDLIYHLSDIRSALWALNATLALGIAAALASALYLGYELRQFAETLDER